MSVTFSLGCCHPFSATPTPAASAAPTGPKSNEDATHEQGESAALETAENNGTAHHGGPGAGGAPNEDPAHEAGESAAREAAENSGAPKPPPTAPSGQ